MIPEQLSKLYYKQMHKLKLVSDYDTVECLSREAETVYNKLENNENLFIEYIHQKWLESYANECAVVVGELIVNGFNEPFIANAKTKMQDRTEEEWTKFKDSSFCPPSYAAEHYQ